MYRNTVAVCVLKRVRTAAFESFELLFWLNGHVSDLYNYTVLLYYREICLAPAGMPEANFDWSSARGLVASRRPCPAHPQCHEHSSVVSSQ